MLGHTLVVRAWLVGMYGPMKLVTRKATQLGHVLPQRTPTGEVLSVAAGDSDEFGALTEVVSRAVGALVAYLVIAGLVLSTSVRLGRGRAGRRAGGRAAGHARCSSRCSGARRSSAAGPPS